MGQKVLLVGINRYKMDGADLQGCVNDVTNIRDILLKFFCFIFQATAPRSATGTGMS